jgi:hypothetical protein
VRIVFAFVCGLVLCIRATGQPLQTQPALEEAFPFVDLEKGVGVAYPVLLNPFTIVPTTAILRVCYVRPQSSDALVAQIRNEQNKDLAYSRTVVLPKGEAPVKAEVAAAARIATSTVWPTKATFQRAFSLMNAADMRLVFQNPQTNEFKDEIINLPEGLLLAEKPSGVTVLALELKRPAMGAGFSVGDELFKIGNYEVSGTLQGFVTAWRAATAAAEQRGETTVVYRVKRGAELMSLTLALPPSLKGSLLDMN